MTKGTRRKGSRYSAPVMFYAIAGDIIGGPYEFRKYNVFTEEEVKLFDLDGYLKQTRTNERTKETKTYIPPFEFTDDSALSVGLACAARKSRGKSKKDREKIASDTFKEFYRKYPNPPGGYGPTFKKWARDSQYTYMYDDQEVYGYHKDKTGKIVPNFKYKSDGDGSGMRVSSAGQSFKTIKETLEFAEQSAMPTHASDEAIRGAQAIAAAIHLARGGRSKEEIKFYIETTFGYDLSKSLDEIRAFNRDMFNKDSYDMDMGIFPCAQMALTAFLNSENYVDCITKTMTLGGDSDTIGAMSGAIAGAAFGMPRWMKKEIEKRLDPFMLSEVKKFEYSLDSADIEPDQGEIEVALAKAKLEKYIADKFAAANANLPNDKLVDVDLSNDQDCLDKLAELEATRLFYEEVKQARENEDAITEQALMNRKEDLFASMKDKIKNDPVFKEKAAELLKKAPGERIEARDWGSRQYRDSKPLYVLKRTVAKHDAIPEKIVEADAFKEMIGSSIKNEKAVLEERAKQEAALQKQVDEEMKNVPGGGMEDDEDNVMLEAGYTAEIENLLSLVNQYFPDGAPKEVNELSDDIARLRKAQTDVPDPAISNDMNLYAYKAKMLDAQRELAAAQQALANNQAPQSELERIEKENDEKRVAEATAKLKALQDEAAAKNIDLNKPLGMNAKEAQQKLSMDDPEKLREGLENKLEKLSGDIMSKAIEKNDPALIRQLAFISRIKDSVVKMQDAPVTEKEAFDLDRSGFDYYEEMLKDARTGHDSKEYKAIISMLKEYKQEDSKPKPGKENDTPRTAKQDELAKLASLQLAIHGYIGHKGRDGVKKNTYHKLAAVEQLNEFITNRITELAPRKSFIYMGVEIPKTVINEQDPFSVKNGEIAGYIRDASARGAETYAEEAKRTLNFMQKILKNAPEKNKRELREMQNRFLKDPGDKETVKVPSLAKSAESSKKASGERKEMAVGPA